MTTFLQYFFYKNFAFTFSQFLFAFFCGFTAQVKELVIIQTFTKLLFFFNKVLQHCSSIHLGAETFSSEVQPSSSTLLPVQCGDEARSSSGTTPGREARPSLALVPLLVVRLGPV